MAGQIIAFAQEHRQPAASCIGSDTDTIDTAANYGDVIELGDGLGGMWHGLLLGNERVCSVLNMLFVKESMRKRKCSKLVKKENIRTLSASD